MKTVLIPLPDRDFEPPRRPSPGALSPAPVPGEARRPLGEAGFREGGLTPPAYRAATGFAAAPPAKQASTKAA
jgi:hypothetical protein